MTYLFDSQGRFIAIELNEGLFTVEGKNIGRYLRNAGIYVDLTGRYLGEIININRLAADRNSRHHQTSFGRQNRSPDIDSHSADVKRHSPSALPPGYEDISPERLR